MKNTNKHSGKKLGALAAIAAAAALAIAGVNALPCNTASAATAVQTTAYATTSSSYAATGAIYTADDQFTSRDLEQTPDLSEATYITVSDGQDITITEAGVYALSGTASGVTVYVDAASDAKVQLVLDGLNITNADFPCVYVKSADKVFVTTTSDSSLSVTGSFRADGDTNTDGAIFSRCDITLNGTAQLTIRSTDNGVVGKDDVKLTGGSYVISAGSKAIEANDSIRVAGGAYSITAGTDGLHAENDDDPTQGYIYICGGELTIKAGDDGIHAQTVAQFDGGTVSISAGEGIEATYIQLNDGAITIQSNDDGINAAYKSNSYYPTVEINGGELSVSMSAGDTDAIDSNGNIYVNGGYISITGSGSFDYDGTAQYNGGTIIVNGQQIDYIPNQMMGQRGGMGGFSGQMGGMNGQMGGKRR